eukprot:CAMPEP_0116871618 /NCGR_PEP_ID=MMETSP0463-20121206/2064_1 /TAXON_ID=181622 /ORGANISM="Strombidinopsis sp, Strain SopsisLIS2011" /LENGTH=69 /DNA_ID=CAMNT_0004510411 /DNA_START=1920 /DNA_END=2129 /DNA_ORIENTATION=+
MNRPVTEKTTEELLMNIKNYKPPNVPAAAAAIPEVEAEASSPTKMPILPDFDTGFERVIKSNNDDFRQE